MKKFLFTIFFSGMFLFASAQQNSACRVGELPSLGSDTSAEFKADYLNLFRERNCTDARSAAVTIPVAVHVIYKNSTEQIGNDRIQAIIDIANQDYSRTNPDASQTGLYGYYYSPFSFQAQYLPYQNIAANMNIQFCLSAVTYDATSIQSFSASNTTGGYNFGTDVQSVKDAYPYYQQYPPANYLNMWICDIANYSGYATFPSYNIPPKYDGITVDYTTFFSGSNEYRAFTHEVGHWLGLFHTFQIQTAGCSEDFINDIYPVEKPNIESASNSPYLDFTYGPLVEENNPCYSWNACTNWNVYPQGIFPYVGMADNYMDYSPSYCWNFFSAGQKSRIDYILNNERVSLKNQVLNGNCTVGISEIQHQGFAISVGESISIYSSHPIQSPLKVEVYDILGKVYYSEMMNQSTMTIAKQQFSNGIYFIKVGDNFVYRTAIVN
jgi:hypothetical protein